MFDLYAFPTTNSHKVAILLEELGLPYKVHLVNVFKGEQFQPQILKLNPLHQVPILVNRETGEVFRESAAILIYLAETYDTAFLPTQRTLGWQWLLFEAAALGPLFRRLALTRMGRGTLDPATIDPVRGMAQLVEYLAVLEAQLTGDYIGGNYSIVDIALWVWINALDRLDLNLQDYPRLGAWHQRILARPAIVKGLQAISFPAP